MKAILSLFASTVAFLYSGSFVFACNMCPGEDPADLEKQTIRGAITFVVIIVVLIGLIVWGQYKRNDGK